VVATCYLLGVSTRRMDKLVQALGITGLSKSQVSVMAKDLDEHVEQFRTRRLSEAGPFTFVAADALVLKVREGGRVVPVHVLVATGVNADGHREILGVQVTTSEDGAGWLAFFRDLTARGLTSAGPVKLVTSDAHAGLVSAIAATLPGTAWQRCRTHYAANLMSATPKSSWGWVKALLHSIYDQPDAEAAHAQFDRVVNALTEKLPTVADHLEQARADILAFTAFPKEVWRQIWSNNPMLILSHWPGWCLDLRFFVLDVSGTRVFGGVSGLVVRGGFRVGLGRVARAGRRGLGRGRAAVAGCRPPVRRSFGVRVAGVA
jgi:putative transposase